MRKVLVAVVVLATLMVGAPAVAGNAEFPPQTLDINSAEGVDVDLFGNVYVSAPTVNGVEIWKFNRNGEGSVLALLEGYGAAAGVTVRGRYVYAAVGFGPEGVGGVWKIHRRGQGSPVLVDGTDQIIYPNAIAFDWRGNMFITETFSFRNVFLDPACNGFGEGGLWKVSRGGTAELLLSGGLLNGSCEIPVVPFPVGANGIVYSYGSLFIAASEQYKILEIPVDWRGNLGDLSVFANMREPDGDFGAGADGLDADLRGDIYVANITEATILKFDRQNPSTDPEVLATGADGLIAPASVAVQQRWGQPVALYATNLWLGPPPPPPIPGLVKIDL